MPGLEKVLEDNLIKLLTTGKSQWTYNKDVRDEASLWKHIIDILNQNNLNKLGGPQHLLTDGEIEQVKNFILEQAESPYKAAVWLAGENGLAQIPIKRDDASLGEVWLDAINNKEISGGTSTYEVINQYVAFKTDENDRDRRFDVTLLINGFPLIHIELKNQAHSCLDAFRQIKKYTGEGKFRGVFGLVQMFVVSNGTDTQYFAAARHNKLNEKFLINWVDKENNYVGNYLEFAKAALNIPQAHLMVGKYAITDANSKSLILLRPYQIHAIEAVKAATVIKESGFIWHTTGSGKTITSFIVSRNLLDIPSIDKAIFLIDRKDLDQQTTISFQSYAQSSGDKIEETSNTKALENNLKSKDRIVIVATRQKLDCLLEKCNKAIEAGDKSAYYYKVAKKIKEKNVAFIVDECHRAISAQSHKDISEFFDNSMKKALWYGFTGTPIFAENKKGEKGNLARTTEDLYGPCLHQYTIKEALHDHAVLGFQVQNSGFSRGELEEVASELKIPIDKDISDASRAELESSILTTYKKKTNKNFYDSPKHRAKVINYIVNKSTHLLHLKEPKGEAFSAILTVPCIDIAQKYYKELKEFIANGGVKENVKQYCSDFPKFAITYSVGENEDGAEANQQMMKESLDDYNKLFNTHFTLENIPAYNADLNDRLARKKGIYKVRENQLDLVIVVDRLLTGFDSPCTAVLYIDRPPMSPQGIIQAFSRTNRIFNEKKSWGHIVTFQVPGLFTTAYEKALSLYSNGGGSSVQAPTYAQSLDKFVNALAALKNFAEKPDDINLKDDKTKLKQFAKLYQSFDKALAAIKTYEEWDNECASLYEEAKEAVKVEEESSATQEIQDQDRIAVSEDTTFISEDSIAEQAIRKLTGITITKVQIDGYTGKYKNVVEIIKKDPKNIIDLDIDYELESVSQAQVDYEYLMMVIQKYFSMAGDDVTIKVNDSAIERYLSDIENNNPKLGEVIRGVWENLKNNPGAYKGKQAIFVINDEIEKIISEKLNQFCNEWKVLYLDMNFLAQNYVEGNDVNLQYDYQEYLNAGGTLTKLKYRKTIRELAKKLIVEEVLPLRRR